MKPKTNKGSNKQLEEYKKEYLLVTNLYKELYTDYNGLNEEQLLNNEEKILHEIISIITKTISITKRRDEIDIYLKELETINKRLLAVTNRMEELGVNIYNHNNHINTDLQRLFIMMTCNSKVYTKQHQDKLKDAIVVITAVGNRSMHGGADDTVTIEKIEAKLNNREDLSDFNGKQLSNILNVEHLGIKYIVKKVEANNFGESNKDIQAGDILHIKEIDANKDETIVDIIRDGQDNEEVSINIKTVGDCCLEYYNHRQQVISNMPDMLRGILDSLSKIVKKDKK